MKLEFLDEYKILKNFTSLNLDKNIQSFFIYCGIVVMALLSLVDCYHLCGEKYSLICREGSVSTFVKNACNH